MKVKEVKIGQVFNIDNTPSYPKIKTYGGYIDIRDSITNNSGDCDDKLAEIIPLELLAKNYEGTVVEVIEWIIKQTNTRPI